MIHDSTTASAISSYARIFGFSSVFGQGWIRQQPSVGTVVTTSRSVRGIDEDRPRSFLDTFVAPAADATLCRVRSQSLDVAKPAVYDISPTGNTTASLYNAFYGSSGGKEEKRIVELSMQNGGSFRLDVSDLHGTFAADSWFGGCSWSSDERYFTYVASIKQEKPETFFSSSQPSEASSQLHADGTASDSKGLKSTKYRFVDDWGEKFTGVEKLGLFVLDIHAKRVVQITGIDEEALTVGQPCFLINNNNNSSNSSSSSSSPSSNPTNSYVLVYTAWKTAPRKLGMIYCYQRPSMICAVDVTELLRSHNVDATAAATAAATTNTTTAAISDAESSTNILHHVVLTKSMATARSPRCAPDGKLIVFLGSKTGFSSHNGCIGLHSLSVLTIMQRLSQAESSTDNIGTTKANNANGISCIVDEVADPFTATTTSTSTSLQEGEVLDVTDTAALPFPGIYCDQLPRRCFLMEGNRSYVVFATQWGSSSVMVAVSLESGDIQVVDVASAIESAAAGQFGGKRGSVSLLDVQSTATGTASVLCVYSTPISPPVLALIEIVAGSSVPTKCSVFRSVKQDAVHILRNAHTAQQTAADEVGVADELSGLEWRIFQHVKDGIAFESILIHPAAGKGSAVDSTSGLPLVLVPHGGPHSCTPTSFVPAYAFLSSVLGAAVLHVNYRGSTGFGQRSIDSLLGKIGRNDVSDMMQCVEHAKTLHQQQKIQIDATRIAVVGGSHGGFLSGHLIGQYPDIFKAACMRNPVVNIPSMVGVSDIPDWCFVEALGDRAYDFDSVKTPSEEQLVAMRRCSPVAYIDNVRTPTLLCVGSKDRRVPPSQGQEYYHLLRARGVKTRLMMFPEDDHAIDKPASEAEHWVNIANWIREHCCDIL